MPNTSASRVVAPALALLLVGCSIPSPPGSALVPARAPVDGPPLGSTTSAVALAGPAAGEWEVLLDQLRAEVTRVAASAVDRHRFLDEPIDGPARIELTPPSPLGEIGLHGDAEGSVIDGTAQFTTTQGVFVFDGGRGQRWFHEAVLRVPACIGGDELRGRLTLLMVQEYATPEGGRFQVEVSGSGEPVSSRPGSLDLDLRVGITLIERSAGGVESRGSGWAEVALRDIQPISNGLADAVTAAIAEGGLLLRTDDERVADLTAELTATLASFAPAAAPGFERAFLAAGMGEGCVGL